MAKRSRRCPDKTEIESSSLSGTIIFANKLNMFLSTVHFLTSQKLSLKDNQIFFIVILFYIYPILLKGKSRSSIGNASQPETYLSLHCALSTHQSLSKHPRPSKNTRNIFADFP